VVIGVELGRENYDYIPAIAFERGWNHLMPELILKLD
jgi:hypothetical protein